MAQKSVPNQVSSPSSIWLTIWHWVFNVSLTAVFVTLLINWPDLLLRLRLAASNSIFQNAWLFFCVVPLLLLLTAFVHELGHLLAGYWMRFRFQMLVIGPLRISTENGRLRFQRQRGGSFFDGLAASLPQETDNLARRLLYFALGGPLASFALTVVSLGIVLFLGADLARMLDYLWLWECCLFTAVVSYFFLLTSMRPGAYQNGMIADGGRILMLAAQSPQGVRWQVLVKLTQADMAGERPSQWDATLLQQALIPKENSHDYLTAVVMNYHHCLDKKLPREAANYLEKALDLPIAWESGLHTSLKLEKAFLAAAYLQDSNAAHDLLGQIKIKRHQENTLFWRAQAALFLLDGKKSSALETAAKGLASIDKDELTGRQNAEIAYLNNLMEKARP